GAAAGAAAAPGSACRFARPPWSGLRFPGLGLDGRGGARERSWSGPVPGSRGSGSTVGPGRQPRARLAGVADVEGALRLAIRAEHGDHRLVEAGDVDGTVVG